MTATRDFAPRLMPAPQAAHYIGVSQSKLRTLGLPRRQLDGKRVYDKADLDAYADDLPYEKGESKEDENTCDGLFGVSG